jgi:predicted oxidoreductase
MDADVIVVGGGLAGLVATCELLDAGRKVEGRAAAQAVSQGGAACDHCRPAVVTDNGSTIWSPLTHWRTKA